MYQVSLIFLGGLLTFISTGFVELFIFWLQRREKRQNFIIFLLNELESIKKNLDLLFPELEGDGKNLYRFNGKIKDSARDLKDDKHRATLLPSRKMQVDYLNLITDLIDFSLDLGAIDSVHDDSLKKAGEDNKKISHAHEYFEKRRLQKSAILVDLKRRVEEMYTTLELK